MADSNIKYPGENYLSNKKFPIVKIFNRKKKSLAYKLFFVTEILFENFAFDKKKSAAESFTVVNAAPLKNHPSIQSDQLSLVLCPTNRGL